MPASRRHPLGLDRMIGLADAKEGLADADRLLAIQEDARKPGLAAIEEGAIRAAEILGNQTPVVLAEHTQVPRGDIGIVDDDVIVIAAADADFWTGKAVPACDVAMTR